MKYVNNILFALILPAMILSFTGASFHFHICADSGKIFSHIHLPEHQPDNRDGSCCCGHEQESNKCCDSEPLSSGECENDNSDCCFSIEKEIETDSEYNISTHRYNPEPVEITSLFHWKPEGFNPQPSGDLFPDPDIFVSPTKLHSSIVLLI